MSSAFFHCCINLWFVEFNYSVCFLNLSMSKIHDHNRSCILVCGSRNASSSKLTANWQSQATLQKKVKTCRNLYQVQSKLNIPSSAVSSSASCCNITSLLSRFIFCLSSPTLITWLTKMLLAHKDTCGLDFSFSVFVQSRVFCVWGANLDCVPDICSNFVAVRPATCNFILSIFLKGTRFFFLSVHHDYNC